jgi:hypothetical protein
MPSNKICLHNISRTQISSVDNKIYDVGYVTFEQDYQKVINSYDSVSTVCGVLFNNCQINQRIVLFPSFTDTYTYSISDGE